MFPSFFPCDFQSTGSVSSFPFTRSPPKTSTRSSSHFLNLFLFSIPENPPGSPLLCWSAPLISNPNPSILSSVACSCEGRKKVLPFFFFLALRFLFDGSELQSQYQNLFSASYLFLLLNLKTLPVNLVVWILRYCRRLPFQWRVSGREFFDAGNERSPHSQPQLSEVIFFPSSSQF
jgi:hypothetical protein